MSNKIFNDKAEYKLTIAYYRNDDATVITKIENGKSEAKVYKGKQFFNNIYHKLSPLLSMPYEHSFKLYDGFDLVITINNIVSTNNWINANNNKPKKYKTDSYLQSKYTHITNSIYAFGDLLFNKINNLNK